ncbi:MAG: GNAT family N-acetyltransferase [Boseongicola sp.]|nr:GNAT family N-acetyltransferase [Boseongicola sp.]NNL17316.1 GNAT family N-acetyltransferase [Boseongicola sp.]
MTQLLHLATLEDTDKLAPMIAAYHDLEGIETDEDHRRAAITPLLEGSPHGAIWLIGPKMSPVGYVAVTFGWSIEMGGLDGFIDELWIREKVRGRGMGSEAVATLKKSLKDAGLMALHLEVSPQNTRAEELYGRLGFARRPFNLMTWTG